jgi:hypothetical protein
MTRRTLLAASFAIVAAAGTASTLYAGIGVAPAESREPSAESRKGPPWISIEYPPSPYDRATRDAFLLVHAYHHGTPADFPVSGRAEGMVDGKRRTIELQFQRTSRPGVFALRKQWPGAGRWVLSLGVHQGDFVAGALVRLGADGRVAAVDVPVRRSGADGNLPRAISAADIEAALRGD